VHDVHERLHNEMILARSWPSLESKAAIMAISDGLIKNGGSTTRKPPVYRGAWFESISRCAVLPPRELAPLRLLEPGFLALGVELTQYR
jgi:hypothetical protein